MIAATRIWYYEVVLFIIMCGENGTAQIDYWNLKGKILQRTEKEIKWEDEIPSTLVGPSITFAPRTYDTVKELPLPDVSIDEGIYYRNFIAAIEGREELYVKPKEVRRTTEIIDSAFLSGQKN